MAGNSNLGAAKNAKNDEFYTQYADIQKEVNAYLEYNPDVFRGKTILLPCDDPEWSNFTKFFAQNFEEFGLKKLISTSFAPESKTIKSWQPTLFETENPNYDKDKSKTNGKIFILERDVNNNGTIDYDDLEWDYLEGDGDFRSNEVKKLRDEADIIITNPPFSLFIDFMDWVQDSQKKFIILGRMSAIHYSKIFTRIKTNDIWVGYGFNISLVFKTPYENNLEANRKFVESQGYNPDENYVKTPAIAWFTNIEHGRRHQPLQLMTLSDNLKYSKHEEIKKYGYIKYDNFEALDVPYTDAIPSDYDGIMGVPDSFLGKYCPEQFELIGIGSGELAKSLGVTKNYRGRTDIQYTIDGTPKCPYSRILIRKKQN